MNGWNNILRTIVFLFLINPLLLSQNNEDDFYKDIDLQTCLEYALKNHR